jgi:hypothetical protein
MWPTVETRGEAAPPVRAVHAVKAEKRQALLNLISPSASRPGQFTKPGA